MYIFFFNDTATTEIYTLSLHDALPIYNLRSRLIHIAVPHRSAEVLLGAGIREPCGYRGRLVQCRDQGDGDRKSTRLNSSHSQISYAVFCLKKKNQMSQENACPALSLAL